MQMPPGGGPPGRPPGPTAPNPLLPGVSPPGTMPSRTPGPPVGRPSPLPTPQGMPGPNAAPLPNPVPGQPQGGNLIAALKAVGIELPDGPAAEYESLGRKSPRGSYDHVYEIVAHDLALWLDKMPKILATAMKGGPNRQSPFKHAATGQQKYEIYKAKLFEEDGSPNMAGRQELLSKMNPKQYAEVVHIVTRRMRRNDGEMQDD
jgi:hypothetical protein